MDAVVFKSNMPFIIFVTAKHTVGLGYFNDPLDSRQSGYYFAIEFSGIADQINFGKCLLLSLNVMFADLYIGKLVQVVPGLSEFVRSFVCSLFRRWMLDGGC